jgi:Zn-dependent peptidase ImmA (M78 family)
MLAGVHYRGKQPARAEDWEYIFESIRRTLKKRVRSAPIQAPRRKKWRSEVATKLAASVGLTDPIAAMKQLAGALVTKAELDGPPTDLHLCASLQGIVDVVPAKMRESGRIIPSRRGLIVQLNEEDSPRRRNFTLAHEIAHTLFPSYSSRPVARSDSMTGAFDQSKEEEYLCDVGASALIFPERWLQDHSSHLPASLESVLLLAETFDASLEATALAWAQTQAQECAVIIWQEKLKPSEVRPANQPGLPGFPTSTPQPKYRISRAFGSPKFDLYLPKDKSAPADSVIEEAARSGYANGLLTLELSRGAVKLRCEARGVPYRVGDLTVERVMSLVRPV